VRTTTLSATTIRIDWVDNSDNETGFRIDSQAGQFTVGPNVMTYSASGLVTGRTYCFNVYAVNAAGETYGGTSCGVPEQLVSPGR
jgi:hypothetical protein